MLCACIDIGSNTTRVLVADAKDGHLREVMQRRVFTRIGKELRTDGRLGERKVEEVAAVVAEHRAAAEAVGAGSIRVVATAAIRAAANREAFCTRVREAGGLAVDVLDGPEEARLAFVGATRTMPHAPAGTIGVVDVGGGSSEIAIGTLAGGVTWSSSFRIGSGTLADAYLREDPPAAGELHRMREHAHGVLEGLEVPRPGRAVAVGGSATSLRRLVGNVLDDETVQRGLRVLSGAPAADVAERFGLEAERVRLLPAGILALEAAAHLLGAPLQVGRGGLREGVCLELASGQGT
jgi:exopolyphosphatase / guanosine-5'-triphosphate,3'-diphosphate pyrophosphatase